MRRGREGEGTHLDVGLARRLALALDGRLLRRRRRVVLLRGEQSGQRESRSTGETRRGEGRTSSSLASSLVSISSSGAAFFLPLAAVLVDAALAFGAALGFAAAGAFLAGACEKESRVQQASAGDTGACTCSVETRLFLGLFVVGVRGRAVAHLQS